MAYTNPLRLANGLKLDFTVEAADTAADAIMGRSSDGRLTSFTSIPRTRVSSGGNLTESTSSVLTITGGTAAVLTSGLTIQVKLATTGQSGYLSSTDWNTFNNKMSTSLTSAYVFVGNGSNVATGVAITGDISIDNTGLTAISTGVIMNADVNASAAIAVNKLAALTVSRAIVSDGSGFLSVSATSSTQIGWLSTLTANVQTQIDTTNQRIVNLTAHTTVLTPGAGQNGYAIIWDNTNSRWDLGPVGAGGSVTGPGSSTDNAIVRWNGTGGTSIQNSGFIIDDSDNVTGVVSITVGTGGLHLLDSDASHDLIVVVGSNLTADRNLTITTGDAARTVTLSGNPTLSDWFDQSVKTSASVVFADATLSNAGGLHILDSDSSHDLIITTSSNLTADRTLTLVTGDANRTLTINASGTIYVTGGTDVSVADGGTGVSTIAARSIWVANATDTITSVTPAAGQSIRINAGNTAWEAFTPGGGGITNGAANTELMVSDGTNAVGRKIFSLINGDLTLGDSGLAGAFRTMDVAGSETDINISLRSKGNGMFQFVSGDANRQITQESTGLFQVYSALAATSTVTPSFAIAVASTGTPAIGIGASMYFDIETSTSNFEKGAYIEAITTNVGSGTEAFDLVFKTMSAGAAATTKLRLGGNGTWELGVTGSQLYSPADGLFIFGNASAVLFDVTNAATVQFGSANEDSFLIYAGPSATTGVAGGTLTLRAGAATVGNANAGSVDITTLAPSGSGVEGGVNIQTRATGKLGFFNVTAIIQPTTGIASSTFVANATVNFVYQESTFDGYKIEQVVKALRNLGILA